MKAAATFFGVMVLLLSLVSSAPAETTYIFNTQEFAPFNYEENGVVTGPVAEIIRLVCEKMKITPSFRVLPWARAQQEVNSGDAHGLFVVAHSKERAELLNFSPAIVESEYGFFTQTDGKLNFSKISDVAGLRVAVYGPSFTAQSLEKIQEELKAAGQKPMEIELSPNDVPVFNKLSAGRADAAYSNKEAGLFRAKKLGLTNLRYAGAHKKLKYYIGFSKKTVPMEVVERFNATYKELYASGEIPKIIAKYSMTAADPNVAPGQ